MMKLILIPFPLTLLAACSAPASMPVLEIRFIAVIGTIVSVAAYFFLKEIQHDT